MAITLRTSNTGSATDGANPSCSITGTQQNDVIIAFNIVSFSDQGSPTGYTQLHSADDGGSIGVNVSYLVAGASPPSSVTGVGTGNAEDSACLIVYVLTGVDTASVSDATPTSNANTLTPPSITTTTDGAWVIGAIAKGEHDASITGNDGVNDLTVTANTGPEFFNCSAAASTYEVDPAGTQSPSAFSWSIGTSGPELGVTIAISPAATEQQIQIGLAWY